MQMELKLTALHCPLSRHLLTMPGVCTHTRTHTGHRATYVVTGEREHCMGHLALKSSVHHLKTALFNGAQTAFVPRIA